LFRRLDGGRKRGIIWIQAPPGAGKTTLISSYLKARQLRCLWYQIDQHDADPATFFHYLGLAARKANPRQRRPLPALTPEYLPGLLVFARRYFEAVASRLRPPCMWVFDNFQELPENSPVHELLYDGFSIIPEGISPVIISRAEPPAALARLKIDRRVTVIDGTELALTRAEVLAIARTHRIALDRVKLDQLHDETGGWAAGLTLLIEARRTGWSQPLAFEGHTRGLLFDYFANEVFSGMDPATRHLLLSTAFLPKVTPVMAERLTGHPGARRVLDDLARRHYFTLAHAGPEPGYEYHALFREFLKARARDTLAPEQLDALRTATATALVETGEIEPAAALLCESQDWPALERLCMEAAEALLTQGRGQTLAAWISALPQDLREASPWLHYWLAMSQHPLDPARLNFAKAFDLFRARNDLTGQLLSWAGIADCYYLLWDEYASFDPWLAQFDSLVQCHPQFPSPQIERRVVSSLVAVLLFRCPQHPAISAWVARLSALLHATEHPGERISIAGPLLAYYLWIGDVASAARLIDMLRGASHSKSITTLHRLAFMTLEAIYCWHIGEFERCLNVVAEALALSASSGLHILDKQIASQGLFARLSLGDTAGSVVILRNAEASLDPSRCLDFSHYHHQMSWLHLVMGDLPKAESHGREALTLTNKAGAVFPRALCHLLLGFILAAREDCPRAMSHILAARRIGHAMKSSVMLYLCLLAEADCVLQQGNAEEACLPLREALVLGKQHGYANVWGGWHRSVMTRLCALALARNIEADHVRSLICRQGLLPGDSSLATDAWPWPVKVYTLGCFRLEIGGQLLKFSGKGQAKPLELLMVLVAFGGRSMPERLLREALWPDSEGDVAHQAFATTLHRLRRLFGQEQALHLDNGRLSFNSRIVWLDVWAFERLLDRIGPGNAPDVRDARHDTSMEETLKLYQGEFLAHEQASWVLSTRERLRSKFHRHHRRVGESLERAGEWARAIEWYEWGIEIDPFGEEICCCLIQCHRQLLQHATAIAVYQRFAKLLMTAQGLSPGIVIQKLYQDILKSAT